MRKKRSIFILGITLLLVLACMQAGSTNSDFSDIEISRDNYFATGEWEAEIKTLDTIVLVSSEYDPGTDTGTQCAGYTTANPSSDPLNVLNYGGSWSSAVAIDTTGLVPDWWYDNSLLPPAVWVSCADPREGSPLDDQWRLFKEDFTIPTGATGITGSLSLTADNAVAVYLNGTLIGTTPGPPLDDTDVYGDSPGPGGTHHFAMLYTFSLSPQEGSNTLMFVVRNWGWTEGPNPTGLLYRAEIEYEPRGGPTEVGGEVYPINLDMPNSSAPWLGVALALVLAAGGGILILSRRRAH